MTRPAWISTPPSSVDGQQRVAGRSDAQCLAEVVEGLGPDELAVLLLVAERLAAGRHRYGALALATDTRVWRDEALEEAADGLAYAACALMRGRP